MIASFDNLNLIRDGSKYLNSHKNNCIDASEYNIVFFLLRGMTIFCPE